MFSNHFSTNFSLNAAVKKNFENRSIFGKDMGKILWLTYLGQSSSQFRSSALKLPIIKNLRASNYSSAYPVVQSCLKRIRVHLQHGWKMPFHPL